MRISRFAKKALIVYMNSWFTSFVFMYCLLLLIGFSAHWLTGCVDWPWTLPVRLLDRALTTLFKPLVALFLVVQVSFLIRAEVISSATLSRHIKRRKKSGENLTFLFAASYLITLAIVGFWVLFIIPMFPSCTGTPKVRAYAIAAAPSWAQLAHFPPSAVITHANSSPGKYEPRFVIIFQGDEQEIQTWLSSSPGTKNVVPEIIENEDNKIEYVEYEVLSEENRNVAVVRVSPDGKEVYILPGRYSRHKEE